MGYVDFKCYSPIQGLGKGRLQNPTAGWLAVLSGYNNRNRMELPVNRQLGFEVVPERVIQFGHGQDQFISGFQNSD